MADASPTAPQRQSTSPGDMSKPPPYHAAGAINTSGAAGPTDLTSQNAMAPWPTCAISLLATTTCVVTLVDASGKAANVDLIANTERAFRGQYTTVQTTGATAASYYAQYSRS
jgi:hypothetical protein